MRPRKKILLLDENVDRLSLRRFVLEQRPLRVVDRWEEADIALIMIDGDHPAATILIRVAQILHPEASVYVLGAVPGEVFPDRVFDADLSMADFLDAVLVGVKRKRGPRRKFLPLNWVPA